VTVRIVMVLLFRFNSTERRINTLKDDESPNKWRYWGRV